MSALLGKIDHFDPELEGWSEYINLVCFCTTCSTNLDEALELFDDNPANKF